MLKPCNHPACRNLVALRVKYCPEHVRPERNYKRENYLKSTNETSSIAYKVRSYKQWQQIRRIKLNTTPLCEDPHGHHAKARTTETARQVHHIKPLATHYHLRQDIDNLMSACYRCHAVFNRQEREEDDRRADNSNGRKDI